MLELKFTEAEIVNEDYELVVAVANKVPNKATIEFTNPVSLKEFQELLPLLQQAIISVTK